MGQGKKRVLAAINRMPKNPPAMGELVVEPALIKADMQARGIENIPGRDTPYWREQEIQFYHRLGLDLVCLQEPALAKQQIARHWAQAGFFVWQILNGCFQTAIQQEGFSQLMMQIARTPREVGAILQDLSQRLVVKINTELSQWVHGIIIADDMAYQHGTYVRPSFLADYMGPLWQRQAAAVQATGRPVFFHSDGNIQAVIPTLLEAGFDGLQCLEPASGMDIGAIKQQYGGQLCLMGNIDPDLLTDDNQPAPGRYPELTAAVDDLLAAAAPGGGFIFGTCSGLYAGLSLDKVRHMYRYARQYKNQT